MPQNPTSAAAQQSLSAYYHASRVRVDTWNRLKDLTARLAKADAADAATERLRQVEDGEGGQWQWYLLHLGRVSAATVDRCESRGDRSR